MSLGTAVRQLQQQYSTAQIREMIRLYTAAYGNSGMNARQVLEEMVCDAMGKMNAFATEETSSVAGEVGQFLRDLRKAAKNETLNSNNGAQDANNEMLTSDNGIQDSNNEAQAEGQKNSAPEDVKHSRELTTDGRVVAVVDEDILSNLDLDNWDQETKKAAQKAATEALLKFQDGIAVEGITREVTRRSRREFTRSEYTEQLFRERNTAFADKMRAANNLDDVVIATTDWARDGKLKHPRTDNFVDFDHGTTLIASGDAKYEAEVVVGITDKGAAVFYDIVNMQPGNFSIKNEEPSTTATTNKSPGDIHEGSSEARVAQQEQNVKQKYSRELDSEYMELAKDPEGNSTELRKMVDQAAEQQGYKTLFYHGSKKGGGFTEFRDWQYFTPKKEYAERYAQRGNPDSLYSVFVKMENPFDTRNAKARRIFQKARGELGLSEIQGTGLPDWTDGYDLADYIDENGLNYDAIVLDEGGDLVNGKPVSRGLSYVVRKSNQVKSADAVVYDDNGKVIPLSERFNSDKGDIRYSRELELDSEGNALTQEQTDFFADSEVRNDDGELIPVYHKTTESFTVFKRGKLGEETLGNASDASLAATSLIGHWFSDSENTPFMGNAMKTYLNIKKPYYTSLDELAADLGDFSGDLEMMQDHFYSGQYNMVREAARSYVRWMKWKGYDGLIVNDTETGGTSYVILNSNQAKLTDNENPTTKRDIRYSRELETVEALKRQNELLQKQRDYWKEQTRTTDEKARGADKGEVRSLANQLIRQYSSKTEVEEILPEMQWLADSIWRNDPKISYTDLQDSAQNIARMVLDGSEVNLNAENWETGQELKRFLRGRYINVDESLKEDIGDFKNFKRSNRSLHFRENGTGTGVYSLWLELQNDFGKGLFPDSISNPGDQIRHIADTLTSLTESDMRNPYAADMELTVEQMAYDVMARAAGLNRQKATKADNTADSPLLYSVRMLTWAEVSWSMLPSS